MKSFKKILMMLVVMLLVVPVGFGLAACKKGGGGSGTGGGTGGGDGGGNGGGGNGGQTQTQKFEHAIAKTWYGRIYIDTGDDNWETYNFTLVIKDDYTYTLTNEYVGDWMIPVGTGTFEYNGMKEVTIKYEDEDDYGTVNSMSFVFKSGAKTSQVYFGIETDYDDATETSTWGEYTGVEEYVFLFSLDEDLFMKDYSFVIDYREFEVSFKYLGGYIAVNDDYTLKDGTLCYGEYYASTYTIGQDYYNDGKYYTFVGWFLTEEGGSPIDLKTYVFTKDTTVYSRWTLNENHGIVFSGVMVEEGDMVFTFVMYENYTFIFTTDYVDFPEYYKEFEGTWQEINEDGYTFQFSYLQPDAGSWEEMMARGYIDGEELVFQICWFDDDTEEYTYSNKLGEGKYVFEIQ